MYLGCVVIICIITQAKAYNEVPNVAESNKTISNKEMDKYKLYNGFTIKGLGGIKRAPLTNLTHHETTVPETGMYQFCIKERRATNDEKGSALWMCSNDSQSVQKGEQFVSPQYEHIRYVVCILGVIDEPGMYKKIRSNIFNFLPVYKPWYRGRAAAVAWISCVLIIFICVCCIVLVNNFAKINDTIHNHPNDLVFIQRRPSTV